MTVAAPSPMDCMNYAGPVALTWGSSDLAKALAAEKAAQARRCRVPADDGQWPEDLAEALMRRVMRNLGMRNLPLGIQDSDAGGIRVGGTDPEIRRLEAPHRRIGSFG